MGIMEPKEFLADGVTRRQNLEHLWDVPESNPRPLDVLLMPGLAFDSAGARCGRGGCGTTTRLSIDTLADAKRRDTNRRRWWRWRSARRCCPPVRFPWRDGTDGPTQAGDEKDGVLGAPPRHREAIASGSRWRGAGEGWDCEVLAS